MEKYKLHIELLDGWGDYSHENPDGPSTFLRDRSEVPGPLQVSYAIYKDGDKPDASEEGLIELCMGLGEQHGWGGAIETESMACAFGLLGTAVFQSEEFPRIQVWHLSNGRDFIMVTHICPESPESEEVKDVQEIVKNITLMPMKAWWKFW